jgi:hypothetical protein
MNRRPQPAIEQMLSQALKDGFIYYVPAYAKAGEVSTLAVSENNKEEAESLLRRIYNR